MQPADIVAREATSWWFESTRGHHCRCDAIGRHRCVRSSVSGGSNPLTGTTCRRDATGRHRYLKSSVLVVRIHSSAPSRCDATGRHHYLRSSVLVVRVHSSAHAGVMQLADIAALKAVFLVVRVHSPASLWRTISRVPKPKKMYEGHSHYENQI